MRDRRRTPFICDPLQWESALTLPHGMKYSDQKDADWKKEWEKKIHEPEGEKLQHLFSGLQYSL